MIRQFVTSIEHEQIHINSGWFEVLPWHQHLYYIYLNFTKMYWDGKTKI